MKRRDRRAFDTIDLSSPSSNPRLLPLRDLLAPLRHSCHQNQDRWPRPSAIHLESNCFMKGLL